MIKYTHREVPQPPKIEETEEEIICNRCGKTHKINHNDDQDFVYQNQFQNIALYFYYGLKRDTQRVEFELCDDCIDEIISGFKYPPEINEKG